MAFLPAIAMGMSAVGGAAGLAEAMNQPKFHQPALVNPADTQNRMGDALARQLASGGTNSTMLTQAMNAASTGAPTGPSLTGVTR